MRPSEHRNLASATAALLFSTALLSACSSQHSEESQQSGGPQITTVETSEDQAAAPAMNAVPRMPDIAPNAAPGVAFNYRYAFVLADDSIAAVQEQHAGTCEKLGPTRCRITGMHYSLIDEDQVRASLDFKLAPELARRFGKEGIAAVENAEGKLVDAAIEGEDVGAGITDSQRRSVDLEGDLKRIEARLGTGGLGDSERAELQLQAQTLRDQIAGEKNLRSAGEEQLANTPMTFTYAGSQGFTLGGDPFGDAMHTAWASMLTMLSFVLLGLGVALPWLVLALLLVVLWRSRPVRALRRYLKGSADPTASDPAAIEGG
jgi:hypothetical protein